MVKKVRITTQYFEPYFNEVREKDDGKNIKIEIKTELS